MLERLGRMLLAAAVSGLAACAAVQMPVPAGVSFLPSGSVQWFQAERLNSDGIGISGLLAVQQEEEGIRFVLTDSLGAPVSRQVLNAGGWQNDGFVMPDREARRLFAALLPVLAAGGSMPVYPDAETRFENGATVFLRRQREMWRTESKEGGLRIVFPDGTRWQLRILDDKDE